MSTPTLLLFDIDLTLLVSKGAGLGAMTQAFCDFTGLACAPVKIRPDGLTDRVIVPMMFEANKRPYTDADYEPFMAFYVEHLARIVSTQTDWRLMPGLPDLLHALDADPQMHLALVTGNDERSARLKLSAFDLNRFFPVGAFASDSGERSDLPPLAHSRAEAHFNTRFSAERVFVIGDSVGDVACARANGLKCIGVATGWTTREELHAAGAWRVLDDLSDIDGFKALLNGE